MADNKKSSRGRRKPNTVNVGLSRSRRYGEGGTIKKR